MEINTHDMLWMMFDTLRESPDHEHVDKNGLDISEINVEAGVCYFSYMGNDFKMILKGDF